MVPLLCNQGTLVADIGTARLSFTPGRGLRNLACWFIDPVSADVASPYPNKSEASENRSNRGEHRAWAKDAGTVERVLDSDPKHTLE
jgi:hypothetical protein